MKRGKPQKPLDFLGKEGKTMSTTEGDTALTTFFLFSLATRDYERFADTENSLRGKAKGGERVR